MRKREKAEIYHAMYYRLTYYLRILHEPQEFTELTGMDTLMQNRIRAKEIAEVHRHVRYFIANRNIR